MEVSTALTGRSVFLTGENVSCSISIRNVSGARCDIAWASVQLQCECVLENEVALKARAKAKAAAAASKAAAAAAAAAPPTAATSATDAAATPPQTAHTAFCPVDWTEGAQVITSAPKVLLCDIGLDPGILVTASYRDRIPAEAPPSYRGKNIRFRYNLLIGTQKVGASIEVVKVPLRVLSSPHFAALIADKAAGDATGQQAGGQNSLSISNPFLNPGLDSDGSECEPTPDYSCLLRAKSKPKATFFDIASTRGSIARLSLLTTEFKLGETILASFDFSQTTIRCVQGSTDTSCVHSKYSACLVCEESVFDSQKISSKKKSNASAEKVNSLIRHCKFHDVCYGAGESSLSLEVPLHLTPTFKSNLCSIGWLLHFDFVIACDNPEGDGSVTSGENASETGFEWHGPQKIMVQTLKWQLPITILPCDPYQVDVSLRNKHSFKFLLKQ